MEVTLVEQRTYIKIAVLRGRTAMECYSKLVKALGNNALQYRTVAQWVVPHDHIKQSVYGSYSDVGMGRIGASTVLSRHFTL
ncbi:HTH_48 domain-containing protein [Trichonephila clavipes]|nr:HTH_48 domain-containing protein [Trichonephila clavipes]